MVGTEVVAMRLAGALGLTTVTAETAQFADRQAYVVSRYDREIQDGVVRRIHQEDLCQATGRTGDLKHQADGGPGWSDLARILTRHKADLTPAIRLMTFFVAIGHADGHAKNISLLHPTSDRVELASTYDVAPYLHYPDRSAHQAAMSVGGTYALDALTGRDVVDEAVAWGVDRDLATATVRDTLTGIERELARLHDETRSHRAAFALVVVRTQELLSSA